MPVTATKTTGRKPRTEGTEWPIPGWWRVMFEEWLEAKPEGKNATWVGDQVGLDASAVSNIKLGKTTASSKLEAICRVTKLPMPYIEVRPQLQEFVRVMNALAETNPSTLDLLLEQFMNRYRQLPKPK